MSSGINIDPLRNAYESLADLLQTVKPNTPNERRILNTCRDILNKIDYAMEKIVDPQSTATDLEQAGNLLGQVKSKSSNILNLIKAMTNLQQGMVLVQQTISLVWKSASAVSEKL